MKKEQNSALPHSWMCSLITRLKNAAHLFPPQLNESFISVCKAGKSDSDLFPCESVAKSFFWNTVITSYSLQHKQSWTWVFNIEVRFRGEELPYAHCDLKKKQLCILSFFKKSVILFYFIYFFSVFKECIQIKIFRCEFQLEAHISL